MTGFRTFQWSNLACPGLWLRGSCYYITHEMVKTSSNADMKIFVFSKVIIPHPICRNIPAFCFLSVLCDGILWLKILHSEIECCHLLREPDRSQAKGSTFPNRFSYRLFVGCPERCKQKTLGKERFLLPRFSKYPVSINRLFLWYFLPSTFLKTYYPKNFRKFQYIK